MENLSELLWTIRTRSRESALSAFGLYPQDEDLPMKSASEPVRTFHNVKRQSRFLIILVEGIQTQEPSRCKGSYSEGACFSVFRST